MGKGYPPNIGPIQRERPRLLVHDYAAWDVFDSVITLRTATVRELMDHTGRHRRRIQDVLLGLYESGHLTRYAFWFNGNRRRYHWQLSLEGRCAPLGRKTFCKGGSSRDYMRRTGGLCAPGAA